MGGCECEMRLIRNVIYFVLVILQNSVVISYFQIHGLRPWLKYIDKIKRYQCKI